MNSPNDASGDEEADGGFRISGPIPFSTRFHRDSPAADEGSPHAWKAVEKVIDHCAALIDLVNTTRPGRAVRDMVLAALLRRAVLTAEGARRCIYHSLEEPALVLLRTLIEVELNLLIVCRDDSDCMAERLAAFHFLNARRHFSQLFGSEDSRTAMEKHPEHHEFMRKASRRMKEYFASSTFDEIRDELKSSQNWHGFKNIEEAFAAVNGSNDYIQLYSSLSPFVHAANLDFDFVDIVDGRPMLRALVQRDPVRTMHLLQGIALILLRIADTWLNDKGFDDYSDPVTVTWNTGETLQISPLNALRQEVIAVFGSGERWEMGESDGGPPST